MLTVFRVLRHLSASLCSCIFSYFFSCGIDEHTETVEKLKGNLRVSLKVMLEITLLGFQFLGGTRLMNLVGYNLKYCSIYGVFMEYFDFQ